MKTALLLIAFILTGSICMAQFTATMKNLVDGQERIYQVYSDGNDNYRYEFTEGGQPGVVIVKPWKNQTIIMMPEKKYWHETTCDNMMTRMNDPVQAAYWFKQNGEEKIEGEEKIGNYLCEKRALYQGEKKVFLVWHSEELDFPVKIVNLISKNTHMELTNINAEWMSNKSYFFVPPDYIKVDENMHPIIPEPPAPESWVSKSLSIPVNITASRGEKIIIDILKTQNYKLSATNSTESPAKFIRITMEDGQELPDSKQGPLKYRIKRIFGGEEFSNVYYWKQGEQVILEVHEGKLNIVIQAENR